MRRNLWGIFWGGVELVNAIATVATLVRGQPLFGLASWLPFGAGIFFIATFALFGWGYWTLKEKKDRKLEGSEKLPKVPTAEFYPSRREFNKSRGDLLAVIAPCREVWLAWWTGSKNWQDEVFEEPNVKKLIIQHPGYGLVETFAKAEEGDIEVYKRNIVATTSRAFDNNVPVVWVQEAIIGLIIAKEKDGKGWARAEYFIPHSVTPNAYPSFIVYENNENEKDLYKRLCKSYEAMFDSEMNVKVTKELLREWKNNLNIP